MRQLLIQLPRGHGHRALDIASQHQATHVAQWPAIGPDSQPLDMLAMHIANRRLEPLIDDLQQLPDLHLTLIPRGVLTLRPPADQAAEQVTDVTFLSPLEVFLAGLQSVGSWTAFLAYAAIAGVVVWIALFTNTSFLLTAAMLIAPFAGPAMNAALATARGDAHLLLRSLSRYAASIAVTIAMAYLLSIILRQDIATELMILRSEISSVAVLLPLVAGAAGALNQMQSQRSNLISGAATGILVAASLAPPAGVVGMAAALQDWNMVLSAAYLLTLQLVGINFSGAVVFRLGGLSPNGPRYSRGHGWIAWTSAITTILLVAALLTWQFWSTPDLQRASRSQRAAATAQQVVTESGLAQVVQTTATFTRANIPNQDTLLTEVWVQAPPGTDHDAIARRLQQSVQHRLATQYQATPLVQVHVLSPPATDPSAQD